jgi:hypothetical protein
VASLRLSTHAAINATFHRALANASCVPGLRARFSRAVVWETSSRALVGKLSEIARLHMYAALPFLHFTNARYLTRHVYQALVHPRTHCTPERK